LSQGQGHRNEKRQKSVFPQCKTSIGNNSGSITHKAMNFVCRRGFTDMAD